MMKQCTCAALLAVAGLMSFSALAAREEHQFEVSVTVPTRAFYIVPSEAGWIHREQILPWNIATSKLGSLRKYFDVRHDTSAIEARLELPAVLSNGRPAEDINLRVRFNGVELSADLAPRLVVTAEDAAVGSRVLLEIEPQQPRGGYRPGDYYGNVLLLFNAIAPGA
ncbi:CS1 type fimbrial major subunit [Pseudomonas sp. SZMC_28357]|uniref:CS1 type fimbrial major subunit n=1 Tax=Pseudomonas sp. SZMC_28357 TaxID=3074380 RepID=UPI00287242F3|nr:CS1 type fimbrial major subunit [Pseudomonas sp. SZMC_28357]MDR9754510.1 CS1 type fimbrial major subunit [Pseudomonas sp. SZMC_28357]